MWNYHVRKLRISYQRNKRPSLLKNISSAIHSCDHYIVFIFICKGSLIFIRIGCFDTCLWNTVCYLPRELWFSEIIVTATETPWIELSWLVLICGDLWMSSRMFVYVIIKTYWIVILLGENNTDQFSLNGVADRSGLHLLQGQNVISIFRLRDLENWGEISDDSPFSFSPVRTCSI